MAGIRKENTEYHKHTHDHNGHHTHSHTHDPAEIKKIVNSLSRTIGHLESTKKMLMDGQDCADVLIQLAAIKGEVNNAGKALLKEHLEHCIVEAVAEDDKEAVDKMNKAIDMFMK
jgi:DNA-binding FrmR family transcriptional regulator